ncbi:MAG: hypothetical protein JSS30_00690 [Verrucomicrobia bacterium]|nr:hypothetical protein [Verrucomicrobiota bacterium]
MFYFINYFRDLIELGSFFWFCALAGSGMFLIQFIINIFGITDNNSFGSSEVLADHGLDSGNNLADIRKFKWLSLQAITGFLMMFGWTAITCQKEFELQIIATIGISVAAGIFAALVIRSIFKLAKMLSSSGSIYKIEDAIGKEAYVYQQIPKGGMGKISISLNHLTHEIDAISNHPEDLHSFMRVKVIEKRDCSTVVVTPL